MEKIMTFSFFAKNWVLFQPDQVLTIATWLSVNWRSKKKNFDLGPDCRPPAKEIETSNFVEKVCATRCMFP
jgi:hypothetical protein